jgi:hypothetical protein
MPETTTSAHFSCEFVETETEAMTFAASRRRKQVKTRNGGQGGQNAVIQNTSAKGVFGGIGTRIRDTESGRSVGPGDRH